LDVRAVIRGGGSIGDVAAVLLRAVVAKPIGHRLHLGDGPIEREMYQLGG
jgi:hypothetical protein